MQYKNLQAIKEAIQFTIDEKLVIAAMKFNTSKLRTLLSVINAFANEMEKFKSLDKNDINNEITARLRASYNSMYDAWTSMTSLEISQLPPATTMQYNNLNKAFVGCGLSALNDVFDNFKLKVVSLSDKIQSQLDGLEKIVNSNDMLSKISLENNGKELFNLDTKKVYPLQISSCDSPVITSIHKQRNSFKYSTDSFTSLLVEDAKNLGIKRLVNEDKQINEIMSKTEKNVQHGLTLLDKLEAQYNSNNAIALLSTNDCFITYKSVLYVGQLNQNIPHGVGRYNFASSIFVGQIENGQMKHGVWTWGDNNKNRYEGDLKNDKFDGYGSCVYESGNKYEGEWKCGNWEGHGICYYNDGDKYDGGWKAGKRNGQGICYYNNGDKYDGEWKDNARNGHGICYYNNGDKYDGEWNNGKRNGLGICYYNNGDKYDGEWKDSKFYNGKVTMCAPNGTIIERAFAGGDFIDKDNYKKYCFALEKEKNGWIDDAPRGLSLEQYNSAIKVAISTFNDLGSYLDSAKHLEKCQKELQYHNALFYENTHQAEKAAAIYKKIKKYKDSEYRLKNCKKDAQKERNAQIRKSKKYESTKYEEGKQYKDISVLSKFLYTILTFLCIVIGFFVGTMVGGGSSRGVSGILIFLAGCVVVFFLVKRIIKKIWKANYNWEKSRIKKSLVFILVVSFAVGFLMCIVPMLITKMNLFSI